MAARKNVNHCPEVREKIRISQLLNLLQDNALGLLKRELSAGRIRSAEIALRKAIPDLSAAEIKQDITHRYVARVPDKAADSKAWQEQHEPTAPTLQ